MAEFIYVVRCESGKGDYEDIAIKDSAVEAWEVLEQYQSDYPNLDTWVPVCRIYREKIH